MHINTFYLHNYVGINGKYRIESFNTVHCLEAQLIVDVFMSDALGNESLLMGIIV